jgi:serine/threonine-protein kinase RsbW
MAAIEKFDVSIPSDTSAGQEVQERIITLLEKLNFSARDVFGVRLALEEALVNAIKHGNKMDPTKTVQIACSICQEKVRIVIEDQGPGFDCNTVPDPTADENLEKPGGRGIMLMRSFMSLIEFNDKGNRVTLEKCRDASNGDS